MTMNDPHDAYIAAAREHFRAMIGKLRAQLSQSLPDAEEIIIYDMPGFQIKGTIIAGYAAFSKQCGLYVDPGAIADHADDIAALDPNPQPLRESDTPFDQLPAKKVSERRAS
jgi:uncharacterized protein YdhG (YjbR/CyaY superfamily)